MHICKAVHRFAGQKKLQQQATSHLIESSRVDDDDDDDDVRDGIWSAPRT